eukprot:TRINITY_DN12017_c0_g1_i6.p1 TRINITY_DN12017_c0_g1~~TRINITY_DN12017_c0_g1_i6.p1  ORF type:complete len:101 (+),score=9.54 TRINITY_DN12017_c0_g1_i6:600-902(+)
MKVSGHLPISAVSTNLIKVSGHLPIAAVSTNLMKVSRHLPIAAVSTNLMKVSRHLPKAAVSANLAEKVFSFSSNIMEKSNNTENYYYSTTYLQTFNDTDV